MHIKSFIKVFGVAEFKTFVQRWKLLFLLLVVVTSALWCIGFSAGTRDYLEYKMKNPFIKFIPIEIPWKHADENDYKKDLEKPENIKRFGYKVPVEQVSTWYCYFKGINGKEPDAYIRPIKPESELYNFLMTEPGILLSKNRADLKNAPWSCIVTEEYLFKLGYTSKTLDSATFINYILPQGKTDIYVPIPIAAVVKRLPDDHALLLPEQLFKAIKGDYFHNNPLDIQHENHKKYIRLFIKTTKSKIAGEQLLQKSGLQNVRIIQQKETAIDGWIVGMNTEDPESDLKKLQQVFAGYPMERCYDFYAVAPDQNSSNNDDVSKLIIQFLSLDSIRIFQEYIQGQHKLRVDMNTVETANNFNLFDKTGRILSRVLSIFSILLIVYVVTTLIREHIEKNKRNLGTLKAFGFSNYAILLLYTIISFVIIAGIFIAAYILSALTGEIFSTWLLSINTPQVEKFSAYTQGNLLFMALVFIVIPMVITALILFLTVRKKTPGDLIYERAKQRPVFNRTKHNN